MTDPISIILIALALAMDAFAVSISSGISIKKMRLKHALLISSFFGIFQAMMPILGWLSGRAAVHLMQAIDHWLAFILLFLIGGKMIFDAINKKDSLVVNPLKLGILFILAVSTSIDANGKGINTG